jgi:protein O-GlcNAc transferase
MSELSPGQLVETAAERQRAGDSSGAQALCQQALSADANFAPALHLLGLLTSDRGDHENALALVTRAIEADPLTPQYRTNLGVILERLNRPEEAIAAYRLALEIQPDFLDAHKNLGIVLSKLRRFDESIAAWRAAAGIRPGDAQILNSLGGALYHAGQIEPALLEFATALELQPNFADAYNNVGNALFSRGDADLAIVAYQKAVALNPSLIEAQVNLANALDRQGKREEALPTHAKIAQSRADHAPSHLAAGDAFSALALWEAAADSYRRAVQLTPNDASAHASLGSALLAKMDLDSAIASFRRALELQPDLVGAINNLGVALKEQGLIDESLDCCESAVNLCPADAAIHSNLIYLLQFHPGYDPVEISRQQRRWNDLHAAPLKDQISTHANDRSPDRRLKIGYVSPDLCRHVVGQNLFPLLSEHDHQQFEIHCYSSAPRPDTFTDLLRKHADNWRDVAKCDDAALAKIIHEDRIDILVDLTLHMAGNRLLVFARKPAPVQITWLGYCASTGLETMDYRLSDPYLDPPEIDLSLYSEQTLRLPETWWCYACAGPTPEPAPPPSDRAGHITFGCLNNFAKVSPGSLDLWAEILTAIPRSRMIIHSYPGSHLDAVRERFAAAGVSPDRLEFVPKLSWSEYVQTYGRIDIALDPFPYGGGITTCDALWMGVPLVTLAGQTPVGRGGRSILSNLGLAELAARRPRQYMQTAVTLAESPSRLSELRRNMRPRMLTSPLMNARRFARNIESAYRLMWTNFLSNQSSRPSGR